MLGWNRSDGPSSPRCSIEFHPEDSHGTPISPYERVMRLTRLSPLPSFPSISISSFPRATVSSRHTLKTSSNYELHDAVKLSSSLNCIRSVPRHRIKNLRKISWSSDDLGKKKKVKNRDSTFEDRIERFFFFFNFYLFYVVPFLIELERLFLDGGKKKGWYIDISQQKVRDIPRVVEKGDIVWILVVFIRRGGDTNIR